MGESEWKCHASAWRRIADEWFYSIGISQFERLDYARDHLNELFGKKFPRNFRREHVSYRRNKPEELAVINYTSGTTSYSKGVMIPYRALVVEHPVCFWCTDHEARWQTGIYASNGAYVWIGIRVPVWILCRLPYLFPHPHAQSENYLSGICRYEAQSGGGCSLIIEKIIKKNVLPKLESPAMKILLKVPIINDKIKATVREQMIQAFGGNFYEIIVGGAAFNQEIEQFLKSIDFPYTVGYGMTECAPIICYEDWKHFQTGFLRQRLLLVWKWK